MTPQAIEIRSSAVSVRWRSDGRTSPMILYSLVGDVYQRQNRPKVMHPLGGYTTVNDEWPDEFRLRQELEVIR